MINLKQIKDCLLNSTKPLFQDYSHINRPEKNVDILKIFFPASLWNSPDISNIEDKSRQPLVSNIINGKKIQKGGTSKFRKEVVGILIRDNEIMNDCRKLYSDLLKNGKVNKTTFKATFKEMLDGVEKTEDDFLTSRFIDYLSELLNSSLDNFLMWLALGALLQDEIEILFNKEEKIVYRAEVKDDEVYKYLKEKQLITYTSDKSSFVADIPEPYFWELRRHVIRECNSTLILAGQSLMDAFDFNNSKNIIQTLQEVIKKESLHNLKIIITDPIIFNAKPNCKVPLLDIDRAVTAIIDEILPCCQQKGCKVDIYFVPLLEIDHAVITDDYMVFRSTKLWTRSRRYKGAFVLYQNIKDIRDVYSEYIAHKEYLEIVMRNCTNINTTTDIYDYPETSAMELHNNWRKRIASLRYHCVHLHKLYSTQLINYVANDWTHELHIQDSFVPSEDIQSYDDLFNAENLLDDNTQRVLLPYIRETQELLNYIVKDYDSSDNSGAAIYPSLDLGYPNNVQRLAGGFATGMFVRWQCGTSIIPVDATVNVCSSSVFKLDHFDPQKLTANFTKYLDEEVFIQASNIHGYSFSFDSGNHFLMIAKDIRGEYYLVLHSSANEFKNSYMGLYPIEDNWYKGKIKTYRSGNRYLRYIKDEEARYFATNAKHLRNYNEQIHKWLATKINAGKEPNEKDINIKHHYYMPTEQSIAIGTFIETPGTVVPMFSNVGKPVYLFRIGHDNWKISIDGTQKCLVPHGWGQQIEWVKSVSVDAERNLLFLDNDSITINSKSRIEDDKKQVRNFECGEEFLKIGHKMIKGKIENILYPEYLYCSSLKGKLPDGNNN